MCLCCAMTVYSGLLASQVRCIIVVASVPLSRIAPVKVYVFLTPELDHPDEEE